MAAARKVLKLVESFPMRRGEALPGVQIAYETWGELNAQRDNAVLIFTGLSPSAHAASSPEDSAQGWWEDMIGSGRPIDTRRLYVICINSLGSVFGSTNPSSINPHTGQPYRLNFPVLSIEDIARGGYEVVRSLGIEQLACVIGPSMGGMTVLAFAALYPERVRNLVSISAAARSTPFAIALRSLQREIIRKDPTWKEGNYSPDAAPVAGMRLARKLGMITYRSAAEWQQRFGRERASQERKPGDPFGIDFEVESYLENHAVKFTGQFDPNAYLYLSRAMDLFDLADHGGSVQEALARFQVNRALVIGVETDLLFPIAQQQELADGLNKGGCQTVFARLASLQGHDSFLVDMDRFRPVIGDFLEKL
ncbi:MAG: homoserine O-acetyltransferase [Candidatus Obscuribacterales bacterium]|nr:homoserine O-acetyltransferase [Steroidobacteraceae bacterium]